MLRYFTLLSLVCWTLFGGLLFSCASTAASTGPDGLPQADPNKPTPSVIVLLDHRSGLRVTLISDKWLREKEVPGETFAHRRAAFYSQKLTGNNLKVKVVDDASAQGIWEHLLDSGFTRYQKSGAAPPSGGDIVQAMEIELDGKFVHMADYQGRDVKEIEAFSYCKRSFMDVYNAVLQLQTVDRMPRFNNAATQGKKR